jgi:hypothetical protein
MRANKLELSTATNCNFIFNWFISNLIVFSLCIYRTPLPDPVKSVLEEGIDLFNLHSRRHGRLESTKGTYAAEWTKWEKQLRDTLVANSEYLSSIQVKNSFVIDGS